MSKLISTRTYRIKCNLTFYVDAENEQDAEIQYLETLSNLEYEPEFNLDSEGKEELGMEKELISIEELQK